MIIAIVPAAGKSERMGVPKLLLPLGPRRVIEHVLQALADSQVDETIVVVPPGAQELCHAVESWGATVELLESQTIDMRASLAMGLDRAQRDWAPRNPSAFLVVLADQPAITSRIIDIVIHGFQHSQAAVVLPTYHGRRGHPVLFAWQLADQVRNIPAGFGLNRLVAQFEGRLLECPTDDPRLLEDLDTPEDYDRLRESAGW
jgi:molybdenum cofactor cytidylyltransferase